jgi:hypothetical protein
MMTVTGVVSKLLSFVGIKIITERGVSGRDL